MCVSEGERSESSELGRLWRLGVDFVTPLSLMMEGARVCKSGATRAMTTPFLLCSPLCPSTVLCQFILRPLELCGTLHPTGSFLTAVHRVLSTVQTGHLCLTLHGIYVGHLFFLNLLPNWHVPLSLVLARPTSILCPYPYPKKTKVGLTLSNCYNDVSQHRVLSYWTWWISRRLWLSSAGD